MHQVRRCATNAQMRIRNNRIKSSSLQMLYYHKSNIQRFQQYQQQQESPYQQQMYKIYGFIRDDNYSQAMNQLKEYQVTIENSIIDDFNKKQELLKWKVEVLITMARCCSIQKKMELCLNVSQEICDLESELKLFNLSDSLLDSIILAKEYQCQVYKEYGMFEELIKSTTFIEQRMKDALERNTHAYAANMKLIFALMQRAKSYKKLGKLSEAIADYSEIISLSPDFEHYMARAKAYIKLAEQTVDDPSVYFQLALKDAEHADTLYYISHRSKQREVDTIRAAVLLYEGQFQKVVDITNPLIHNDEVFDPKLLSYRGEAYKQLGQNELALKDFERAEKIYVEKIIHSSKLDDLIQLQRYKEAMKKGERVNKYLSDKNIGQNIVLRNALFLASYAKQRYLEYTGRTSDFCKVFFEEVEPKSKHLIIDSMPIVRIFALIESERYTEALDEAQILATTKKDNSLSSFEAYSYIAWIYALTGRIPESDEVFSETDAMIQSIPELNNNEILNSYYHIKARSYSTDSLNKDRLKNAIYYYKLSEKHALSISKLAGGDIHDIYGWMGRVYYYLGMKSEAQYYYEKALQICPEHVVYSVWRKELI
jgi:tetratricopeptide (TPR) repeat protein